jgi:3-methyl-2-oxobutanoate hydroxymethyltransferase
MTANQKIRAGALAGMKSRRELLVAVTAYDAITGAWAEGAGVDVILAGDSLGNTALGMRDTIGVTLEMMLHHAAAVTRGIEQAGNGNSEVKNIGSRALLVADLPFMTYKTSVEQAMGAAGRMMQEGGVEGVKLEGGEAILPMVSAITGAGIPVMGHLGLLPQSVHQLGGYKTQAKDEAAAEKLLNDAKALEEAGAFAVVLEMVPAPLAARVTQALKIPTIGIGAGAECDGQVLVLSDILGMSLGQYPHFAKQYTNLHDSAVKSLRQYAAEVRERQFPG